jgi:hypothetical protein
MRRRARWPKPSPWEWRGTTDELLGRLRPARYQVELAILGSALIISAGAIIAVPNPPGDGDYQFLLQANSVIVANRRTGDVALCRVMPNGMLCSDRDSPGEARRRKLRAQMWLED